MSSTAPVMVLLELAIPHSGKEIAFLIRLLGFLPFKKTHLVTKM